MREQHAEFKSFVAYKTEWGDLSWGNITIPQYHSSISDILQLLHMEISIKAILPLAREPQKIDASPWFYPHLVYSTPVLLIDRFFVF